MVAKALLEMKARAGAVAEIRKHGAQPLMRLREVGIDPQRGLVMPAGLRVPVGAKQQVGEIDMRNRIFGMVGDRLRIDAGGVDRAHVRQQGAEFVQRAEMLRRLSQDIDEGLLGVLLPVEGAEQNRALDRAVDDVALAAPTREQVLDLSQSGFLRQPWRPGALAAGNVTQRSRVHGSRVLFLIRSRCQLVRRR